MSSVFFDVCSFHICMGIMILSLQKWMLYQEQGHLVFFYALVHLSQNAYQKRT